MWIGKTVIDDSQVNVWPSSFSMFRKSDNTKIFPLL